MKKKNKINRRKFIETASAASMGTMAFHIVPRRALGGKGYIAPSDKVHLAYIGCGTQGLREMCDLITNPKLQITSVCDPNKMSTNYLDWSQHGIRNGIRKVLGKPDWGADLKGIPGGRDIGEELVNEYYNKANNTYNHNCPSYADFRELLEKEKDFDAVKIMTPDHLHGYISVAAMKKNKQVLIHKPLANRMYEARLSIKTAKETGVSTHLLAWSKRSGLEQINKWIQEGQIGALKEIHNWSNRPSWPQWTTNPTDTQSVPAGFNWDLWLGCVPDRPYHPNYTHNVFRGWYEFGGGSIADMGHYSLWPLFMSIGVETPPVSAEANGSTSATVENLVCKPLVNDVAFPASCKVKFKFPKQPRLPEFELFWYDGGMRPDTPDELGDTELEKEGLLLIGDQGKIISGFRGDKPRLLPDSKMVAALNGQASATDVITRGENVWLDAFKNKTQSPGSFLNAVAITETIQLGAVALRAKKKLIYDTATMKITNNEEANKYFYREYRKGWEM